MTAVDLDALDKLRGALAAALVKISGFAATHAQVDALLPVVDRIANERAAAELRALADDYGTMFDGTDPRNWLRARADVLAPT